MRRSSLVSGLLLLLFIAGCASAPQPGTPVTFATACSEDNNGQRVSIEGYPRLSGMILVTDDFSVNLFEKPQGGGDSISVYLTVGTGANQAETLPDDYSDDDLRIHTNTNEVVSTDSQIKVHGELYWVETSPGEVVCFINAIDLIEGTSSEA